MTHLGLLLTIILNPHPAADTTRVEPDTARTAVVAISPRLGGPPVVRGSSWGWHTDAVERQEPLRLPEIIPQTAPEERFNLAAFFGVSAGGGVLWYAWCEYDDTPESPNYTGELPCLNNSGEAFWVGAAFGALVYLVTNLD